MKRSFTEYSRTGREDVDNTRYGTEKPKPEIDQDEEIGDKKVKKQIERMHTATTETVFSIWNQD